MNRIQAAVIIDEEHNILICTIKESKAKAEQLALDMWGDTRWKVLKGKGARVAACEIKILD